MSRARRSILKPLRSAIMGLLEDQRMELDTATYSSLLRQAGDARSLEDVRRVHGHLKVRGGEEALDTTVGNRLVETYGKCGSPEEARAVFDELVRSSRTSADAYSWNLMLGAYTNNGLGKEALELFKRMADVHGVHPDRVTYITAVSAACQVGCLEEGKALHERFTASGLESSIVLDSALMNMYGRCGSFRDAKRMFEGMRERNLVCWNTMVAAYAHNGQHADALELYYTMEVSGMKPDKVTFLNVLNACCSCEALEDGRLIHQHIISAGLDCDKFVGNALLSMYGRCGSLESAKRVFDRMPVKDVASWNALIAAYAHVGHSSEACRVFRSMQVNPDAITFTIVLGALTGRNSLEDGRAVHARMVASGIKLGVVVETALLSMYGKCGSVEEARAVFDNMKNRTRVTWNAMITAYAQHGHSSQAFGLFRKMKETGFTSDVVTFLSILPMCSTLEQLRELHVQIREQGLEHIEQLGNTLISSYSKCRSLEGAEEVFFNLRKRDRIGVICWTCMIEAYVENGSGRRALALFMEMAQEGVRPDTIACVCALDACTSIGALSQGRAIHSLVEETEFIKDVFVATAVVNMYGKCGNVVQARQVFDRMSWRNSVTWNSMIGAYAQHGHTRLALKLYEELELDGIQPDSITFICILFACSHLGLMDKGRMLFQSMVEDYHIEAVPAHFGCIVDLLSRAGWMEEAEELIRSMPIQPGVTAWTALLGACRLHNDMERGALAAAQVNDLEPRHGSPFVALSGLSAHSETADATGEKRSIYYRVAGATLESGR